MRRLRTQRNASALVLLTFSVAVLFAFAALSLDVGNVLREQRRAQIATDAAALAAVLELGRTSLTDSQLRAVVIQTATAVATTNGVTSTEIAAGNGGAIELGTWNTNGTFTVRTTGPYDAVRIPARRTIRLAFGGVVGLGYMRPAVESIAKITRGGMVPFGLSDALLPVGSLTNFTVTIDQKHTGNWGKLDLGGVLRNPNDWMDAFVYGYDGPISKLDPVDGVFEVWTDPGFAKLREGWDLRRGTNPYVVLPVIVSEFPNGHSAPVYIAKFASAELLEQRGSGNGWKAEIRIIEITNDPPTFQLTDKRELVR